MITELRKQYDHRVGSFHVLFTLLYLFCCRRLTPAHRSVESATWNCGHQCRNTVLPSKGISSQEQSCRNETRSKCIVTRFDLIDVLSTKLIPCLCAFCQ